MTVISSSQLLRWLLLLKLTSFHPRNVSIPQPVSEHEHNGPVRLNGLAQGSEYNETATLTIVISHTVIPYHFPDFPPGTDSLAVLLHGRHLPSELLSLQRKVDTSWTTALNKSLEISGTDVSLVEILMK